MDRHLRASRAFWLLSIWYLLLTGFFCAMAYFALRHAQSEPPSALYLMPFVGAGLLALHIWLARAARKRNEVARVVSLILGCLMLFAFPIGTLIGVYLIVLSSSPWSGLPAQQAA